MNNFTPKTDPRIQALAERTAKQIKQLRRASDKRIERLYKQYLKKAKALRCAMNQTTEVPDGETSTDSMHSSGAGSLPTDKEITQQLGD